jgi:hypothetical protein
MIAHHSIPGEDSLAPVSDANSPLQDKSLIKEIMIDVSNYDIYRHGYWFLNSVSSPAKLEKRSNS